MAKCKKCRHRFVLPIRDEKQLLDWASSCEWHRLFRFMTKGGAKGHTELIVDQLIRIYETRRWAEEDRVRLKNSEEKKVRKMEEKKNQQAREKRRIRNKMQRLSQLESLYSLTPTEFEIYVADIFRAKGYEAFAVGGGGDNGVDVEILTPDGKKKWAIAQCKRYAQDNTVGSGAVRNLVGSCGLAGVQKGFFFTTSSYTRQAVETASKFDWLTLYNGVELVKMAQKTVAATS